MEAVSEDLRELIIQVQALPSLQDFALAGGTNLALRFNHRISDDIDLFTNKIIGEAGMQKIAKELKETFGDGLMFCHIINVESGDQYCFLRALITKQNKNIKVEIIQNIQLLTDIEKHNDIRIISLIDIGVMKLCSAGSRKAKKDIYDLDFITEEIPIDKLLGWLDEKTKKFDKEEHKCLFDLDNDPSPLGNISLLLDFDEVDYASLLARPSHSNDRIDLIPSSKNWVTAKASWRRKVRGLMNSKGILPPKIKPIN